MAIGFSLWQAGILRSELINVGGWGQLGRFLQASFQPDLSNELLRLTIHAALVTLAYAVCGTVFSVAIGLLGGILASEIWWTAVFGGNRKQGNGDRFLLGIRAVLAVPRAIHELIWGLFFVNIWGLDPLTAILAIAIPFGAITAKVFAEILDETPRQPLLALLNSGAPPLSAFFYSLFPQAFLNLLSYTFYRFECSIRSAAVLGIIGAGGLGYEILLSLQSLRYEQLWTFFYALFVLNGLVDFSSAWLRQRLGCASRLDLNLYKQGRRKVIRDGASVFGYGLLVVTIGLIGFCFWYLRPDWSKLWSARTGQLLAEIAASSFPPDWSIGRDLLPLALQTVEMSVLAIAIAALGGILLSFPAAHNFFLPGGLLNPSRATSLNRTWAWGLLLFSRAVLLMGRAIPAPIWALVILFVVFPGILPGAIALGIHNFGILGRLMAEVIENLDQRPLQALKAQGTPGTLVFLYGVLPLTLPRFLAYSLYRWEVCMRETVIVGLVGAGGLGRLLTEQLSSFDYRGVIVTLSCFMVLTFLVDWLSATMRRSLR
jgi:phosphonate transport system permease protein